VHVCLLVMLALIPHITPGQFEALILSDVDDEQLDKEFQFDAATSVDMIGNDSDLNVLGPSRQSAQLANRIEREKVEEKLDEPLDFDVPLPRTELVSLPAEANFTDPIESQGGTEYVGGVEGAVDRLTHEIASSLRERPTLVVWLFDASLSLKERRNAIADRFENVYRQLGQMEIAGEKSLKTAVAAYGKTTTILTPDPVEDVTNTVKLVRGIKDDVSGKEYVFSALQEVTDRWMVYRTKRRHNMMVVIVTDERGDDAAKMETTIPKLARYGVRCYVVGNAAVFGRQKGKCRWVYPDKTVDLIDVDQGPESYFPQRLQLGFWGPNGRDLDRMTASYGPYALTRLCGETKGVYLIAEESGGPPIDHAVMREYRPDYRPIKVQQAQLRHPTKRALVDAAEMTIKESIPRPTLVFRADSDTTLRREMTEAQRPLARLEFMIDKVIGVLSRGEDARPTLKERRWQAAYDLAAGRALAMFVRAKGYNVMLAQMKSSPRTFEDKENNTWRLVPGDEMTTGRRVRKTSQQAAEYLKSVIDNHPGTPWAYLAERELSQPMGWKWEEYHRDYAEIERRRNEPPTVLIVDPETGEKKRVPKKKHKKPQL
jgi:hypothetical protein